MNIFTKSLWGLNIKEHKGLKNTYFSKKKKNSGLTLFDKFDIVKGTILQKGYIPFPLHLLSAGFCISFSLKKHVHYLFLSSDI